jgi:hypothetical protein
VNVSSLQREQEPGLRIIYIRGRLAVLQELREKRWRENVAKLDPEEIEPPPAKATIVAARAAALSYYKPEPEPAT